MIVSDVMSRRVITVQLSTPLRQLWELLMVKNINSIPVVDPANMLVGIVSKKDLLQSLYPDYSEFIEDFVDISDFNRMENQISDLSGRTAQSVMKRNVVFVHDDTELMRALSRMIVRHVNQLPVLSDKGILIGIITKADIFRSLFLKHLRNQKTA